MTDVSPPQASDPPTQASSRQQVSSRHQQSWRQQPSHQAWLHAEGVRLLEFGARSRCASGFSWLDNQGRPVPDRAVHTWITARMTHVFSLAHLGGIPGAGDLADHGVRALGGALQDAVNGGWFDAVPLNGEPKTTAKAAYDHAFVVLAASSATVAGRQDSGALLGVALDVVDQRFWSQEEGRMVEAWSRDWTELEPYRGANSNMHMVEAALAAAHASGDDRWTQRALRIAEHLVHEAAGSNAWRLPEHFDPRWGVLPEYNRDRPDHPFRPFGLTIGHWLEWARLLLHLESALDAAPGRLLDDARNLFDAAVHVGWEVDGQPGFVYTVDWQDRPVVRARMHWVLTEAIGAAAVLHERTGEERYEEWYRRWWDHAATVMIDRQGGSWHHELDDRNNVAEGTWSGKPDIYHAYQATVLPCVPLAPSLASALARRGR